MNGSSWRRPSRITCPPTIAIYPLPDDPERCLEDFHRRAAGHARRLAKQIDHQEVSVARFLELKEDAA